MRTHEYSGSFNIHVPECAYARPVLVKCRPAHWRVRRTKPANSFDCPLLMSLTVAFFWVRICIAVFFSVCAVQQLLATDMDKRHVQSRRRVRWRVYLLLFSALDWLESALYLVSYKTGAPCACVLATLAFRLMACANIRLYPFGEGTQQVAVCTTIGC